MTRLPPQDCPYCLARLAVATAQPQRGLMALCNSCRGALAFNGERFVSIHEGELPADVQEGLRVARKVFFGAAAASSGTRSPRPERPHESKCPTCHRPCRVLYVEGYGGAEPPERAPRLPTAGELCLCLECGELLAFTPSRGVRAVTPEESARGEREPAIGKLREFRMAIIGTSRGLPS